MATRAVNSSGHRRAGAIRAAATSSHSSGSSTESGRERRRRGKLKMQQQLAAALSRISDLEQQNHCLRRLVEELLPTGPASPELFDVYDIAEETASVATQTVISVNFHSPDIFVRAEDLPVCGAEQCAAESHIRSLAIAHADAAAGLDVTQATHTADHGTRQSRDDPLLEHRVAHVDDFKSHNLAFSAAQTASLNNEQCMSRQCRAVHHQGDAKCFSLDSARKVDDDLLTVHRVAKGKDAPTTESYARLGHGTRSGTRQALDDHNAEHRATSPSDSKSHELAVSPGSISVALSLEPTAFQNEQCEALQCCISRGSRDLTSMSHDGARQAIDDPQPEHRVAHVDDFKSHSLAFSTAPAAHLDNEQFSSRQCRAVHHQGDPKCFSLDATRQVVDDRQSEHRVAVGKDAPTTESSAHLGHDSRSGTRQALDGHNAGHRVTSLSDPKPYEPAVSPGLTASQHLEQCSTRREIAEHRVASQSDFKSYDLAPSLEHTAYPDEQCEAHQCRYPQGSRVSTGISHDGTQRALDDFKSHNLASSSALTASQANEQYIAHQCRAVHHQGDHKCFSLDSNRQVDDDRHAEHRVANSRKDAPTTESLGHDSQAGTRQALDVHNAEHRATSLSDSKSYEPTVSPGPTAYKPLEQCSTRCEKDGSLAEHRATTQSGSTGARQALDDHHAEHRVASRSDFKSQDLAVSPGKPAFQPLEQGGTRRVIGDPDAVHRVAAQCDFKSFDLAVSLEPTASQDEQCVAHQCRFSRGSRDLSGISQDGTRRALDDPHTEHRVANAFDFKSYNLALSPAPTACRTNEQCMVLQCRAVLHQGDPMCFSSDTRLALDGTNAEHRVASTSEAAELSFGPSALELQKAREPQQTVCSSANSHLDHIDVNAHAASTIGFNSQSLASRPSVDGTLGMHKEPPPECRDVCDSIVKVYTLRKRPTSRHLQEAVNALVRVAMMHGVSLQACAEHVKAQCLTIWCALESHISK